MMFIIFICSLSEWNVLAFVEFVQTLSGCKSCRHGVAGTKYILL